MTSDDFRRLALAQPEATESAHMSHPDFRLGGKVFATLHYPNEEWGMVKLSPEQQDEFVKMQPKVFVPVKGAWGRQGCTNVRLATVEPGTLEEALRLACGRLRQAAKPRGRAKSKASLS